MAEGYGGVMAITRPVRAAVVPAGNQNAGRECRPASVQRAMLGRSYMPGGGVAPALELASASCS